MIQVLSLIKQHGHTRVRAAVEEAITLGCADAAAVRHLVEAVDLAHARNALIELGELSRFERPMPVMTDYDGLLGQVRRSRTDEVGYVPLAEVGAEFLFQVI